MGRLIASIFPITLLMHFVFARGGVGNLVYKFPITHFVHSSRFLCQIPFGAASAVNCLGPSSPGLHFAGLTRGTMSTGDYVSTMAWP